MNKTLNQIQKKQDFFSRLLVWWLGLFSILIPLSFCFYTYDSAQVKLTLFYFCSCGAFFIWLTSLLYKGESLFTKENFYKFLPLLVYAFYIVLSYFLKPYRITRLDSFFRECFSFCLFLVVCFGLTKEDYKNILKYFFIGAWIILGYGLLQILNLDFLPWKNFFAGRAFATLANPNLLGSYAVFTAILIFFSYLIKKDKSLIFLFILALINLIFSLSKGAWLAFSLSVLLGSVLFICFFSAAYNKNKKKIILVSLLLFFCAGISIFYFSSKRISSVSFRLSTWRAAFDMIKASPLSGTGIGSFEIIYPAYKRPEIFYMENLHNIESQHAENYYLEQASTLGLIGFGLFLWVLFYVGAQALFKLKTLVKQERKEAFFLASFTLASASIYIHNFVDVSIYFASTNFFLILFNGAVFNMVFGPFEKINFTPKQSRPLLFKIIFVLAVISLAIIFFYIQKDFWANFYLSSFNNFLQVLYCFCFILISVLILFVFIKIMVKVKGAYACIFMLLAGIFYFFFWCQFISNVHFSRATALAEKGLNEALPYYTKAINKNPTLYTPRFFRGLLLYNRFLLADNRDISAGDKTGLSNDFKRALKDFKATINFAPNAALLHYNLASLYLKYANLQTDLLKREELYTLAQQNLEIALLLDPAYENIYFQLANIELARGNKAKAIFWVEAYLKGPNEVKDEQYLKTHRENQRALEVLQQLKRG